MKTMTEDIKAGRARAVFRVRQKLKSDELKWSPSGKVRAFGRNNRFMFDDGKVIPRHGLADGQKSSVAHRRKPQKHRSGMVTQFLERSNGEPVIDFRRFDLPHSSSNSNRTSIGLSPFDMTKVRAALETKADRIGAFEGVSFNRNIGADENSRAQPISLTIKGEAESKLEESHRSHCALPLCSITAKSMFERIEELLHTAELEEELLRRDFIRNIKGNEQSEKEISPNDEDKMSPSIRPIGAVPFPLVPIERQDRIAEYVGKRFHQVDTQRSVLKNGQLVHPSMIAEFAESIVDSIIKDVASELEDVISESFCEVVSTF